MEKNKSATNPITCGRVNPDIFESGDVASSCPVSYRTINQYGGTTATTGQILPPLLSALWNMLWTHFIADEPLELLQWIRIPSDACGQANSIWIRYVWTGKFLNPERKSCQYSDTCGRGLRCCFKCLSFAPTRQTKPLTPRMAEICVQRMYVITKECFLREPISHEGFISVMYLDSQNNTRRIVKRRNFQSKGN